MWDRTEAKLDLFSKKRNSMGKTNRKKKKELISNWDSENDSEEVPS